MFDTEGVADEGVEVWLTCMSGAHMVCMEGTDDKCLHDQVDPLVAWFTGVLCTNVCTLSS